MCLRTDVLTNSAHQLSVRAGLVIVLSLFVGVKHLWLDYLFTLSIAMLANVVYLVIDDLDDPLRPGIWHVTSKRYERLLAQLQLQT